MYYVLGDGGTRYGPADLATLKSWVQEGRVLPQTMLEQVVDGQVIPAAQVPDLFGGPAPQPSYQTPNLNQPTQHAPYQNPSSPYQGHPGPHGAPSNPPTNSYQNSSYPPATSSSSNKSQLTGGWVCFGIGCVLCFPCCSVLGIVLHIIAITIGVKEKNNGNPQGATLVTLASVFLALNVIGNLAFWIISAMSK